MSLLPDTALPRSAVEEFKNYIDGEWVGPASRDRLDNIHTTGNLINARFGGLKRSSTSTFRESGRGALEFFTQIKTIYRGI
jgi:hypothetical protein